MKIFWNSRNLKIPTISYLLGFKFMEDLERGG